MPVGPRPTTANTAEVTMEFTQDGQHLFNKHHFFDDAGWDEGRLNNLGTAVREWWDDNLKVGVSATVSLVAITCRDLSVPDGLQTAVTVGLPSNGTNNGPVPPNSVTVAIKKATGRSGRSFHGRTYHVGITMNDFVQNTLNGASIIALRDKYSELMTPGGGLFDPQLCVLSEVTNGNWRANGICTVVTGIGVDQTIDNQRRRLPGRGR